VAGGIVLEINDANEVDRHKILRRGQSSDPDNASEEKLADIVVLKLV